MKNKNQYIPIGQEGLLKLEKFEEEIQIYWGPGITLSAYPNYTPPTNWRGAETINIPRVVRMVHASKEVYDSDGYSDEDDGTSPPIPPEPTTFSYRIDGQSTDAYVFPNSFNPGSNGEYYQLILNPGTPQATISLREYFSEPDGGNIPSRIVDRFSNIVFEGTLRQAANSTYMVKDALYRTFSFFITEVQNQTTFIRQITHKEKPWISPSNDPPPCWGMSEITADYPVSYPTLIIPPYINPQNGASLRNWFGCSETPGGPPVAPAPPPSNPDEDL